MHAFLTTWFAAPPTDRLAAAFLHYRALDEGARTFTAYDSWLRIMQDADAREELKVLRAADRARSDLWQEIRSIADVMQRGLIALLFDTDLRRLAPQFAVF